MCNFTYNICLAQYASYNQTFIWTTGGCVPCGTVGATGVPVDLTGYTAMMQIRPWAGSPTLLYDASSDITLYGITGEFTINISAADTSTFTWPQAVYDLLMTDPYGNVTRLMSGTVTVSTGVTT